MPIRIYTDVGFVDYHSADSANYYYTVRDYQGSVRRVLDRAGNIVQATDYLASGVPVTAVQQLDVDRHKYTGYELLSFAGVTLYDSRARWYNPLVPRFNAPDNLAESTPQVTPYGYCAGDPINHIDPTGCEIRGVSREDASYVVQNIRAIFPDEDFEQFRNLIVQSGNRQNGYTLKRISDEDLSNAFAGITLNDDQQAMVDIVVNTINSKSKHYIEYVKSDGILSKAGTNAIAPHLKYIDFQNVYNEYGHIPAFLVKYLGGGGITAPINNGTHSIILNDLLLHPHGISVTTGHEIFGHGRPQVIGHTSFNQQHVDAIQTENLILRMMGISFINTGEEHGPRTIVPNHSDLPSFR